MINESHSSEKSERYLAEIVALLAVLVKRGVPQAAVVTELGAAGIAPKRIAELIGTTSNTVRVALHAARQKAKKRMRSE